MLADDVICGVIRGDVVLFAGQTVRLADIEHIACKSFVVFDWCGKLVIAADRDDDWSDDLFMYSCLPVIVRCTCGALLVDPHDDMLYAELKCDRCGAVAKVYFFDADASVHFGELYTADGDVIRLNDISRFNYLFP